MAISTVIFVILCFAMLPMLPRNAHNGSTIDVYIIAYCKRSKDISILQRTRVMVLKKIANAFQEHSLILSSSYLKFPNFFP